MTRARLLLAGALLLALLGIGIALGRGTFGEHEGPGEIAGAAIPRDAIEARTREQREAFARLLTPPPAEAGAATAPAQDTFGTAEMDAVGPTAPDESILFGDLHVHTSISMDAYLMSLPLAGGEGAHPAADACDFARYCSALDFCSLNDHAESSPPRIGARASSRSASATRWPAIRATRIS